jgi:hypothetical protein
VPLWAKSMVWWLCAFEPHAWGESRPKPELAKRQIMRNGQNKRMRGRNNNNNNRKSQNPLTRLYESNGPDVKIRGTASHVAEKYIQLARDSQASGDPVAAENYYQHAEHYFRMIAAAQEQFRQGQPSFQRPEGETRDDSFDNEGDDQQGHPMMGGSEPSYGNRDQQQQQPYPPRDNQSFQPRDNQQYPQHRDQQPHYNRDSQSYQPREQQPRPQQPTGGGENEGDVERLPSFITGGGQPQPQPQTQGYGQNGHEGQPDRFPLHRRRRRHRGHRGDMPGGSQGGDPSIPRPPTND